MAKNQRMKVLQQSKCGPQADQNAVVDLKRTVHK